MATSGQLEKDWALVMILLFTSKDCTWCDLLKDMIVEETDLFGESSLVCEIDVDSYARVAKAYGIMTVPTMVARSSTLSGVPEPDDLRSFLFRALSERTADSIDIGRIIDHALLLRKAEFATPQANNNTINMTQPVREEVPSATSGEPPSQESSERDSPEASSQAIQ